MLFKCFLLKYNNSNQGLELKSKPITVRYFNWTKIENPIEVLSWGKNFFVFSQ